MTSAGSDTEAQCAADSYDVPQRRITLRAASAEGWREFRRIRNHLVHNTLAGSPLIPKPLRWCLYRISGLKIYSPNVAEQCVMHNGSLEIGKGVFVNRECYFEGGGRIVIGEDTQIGPQCLFLTSHHDAFMVNGKLRIARPVRRDVLIGARVWIGARAMFLPGSSVDDDVVVAAGAVVNGHLTRGWLYAGVPAKKIKPIRELSSESDPRLPG